LVAACIYFLLVAGGMVWYSKVGKLRMRDRVLELILWRGDEMVLDIGCGRGLLLIGAAGSSSGGSEFSPTQKVIYRGTVDGMAKEMDAKTFNWSSMDDPIIVDAKGNILQGHHRIVAARLARVRIPPSAIQRTPTVSPRDPRPWGNVTVKPGLKP
jgi:hypothetical protein